MDSSHPVNENTYHYICLYITSGALSKDWNILNQAVEIYRNLKKREIHTSLRYFKGKKIIGVSTGKDGKDNECGRKKSSARKCHGSH